MAGRPIFGNGAPPKTPPTQPRLTYVSKTPVFRIYSRSDRTTDASIIRVRVACSVLGWGLVPNACGHVPPPLLFVCITCPCLVNQPSKMR